MDEIADDATLQKNTVGQVNNAIDELSKVVQIAAASSEETAGSAEMLSYTGERR